MTKTRNNCLEKFLVLNPFITYTKSAKNKKKFTVISTLIIMIHLKFAGVFKIYPL